MRFYRSGIKSERVKEREEKRTEKPKKKKKNITLFLLPHEKNETLGTSHLLPKSCKWTKTPL